MLVLVGGTILPAPAVPASTRIVERGSGNVGASRRQVGTWWGSGFCGAPEADTKGVEECTTDDGHVHAIPSLHRINQVLLVGIAVVDIRLAERHRDPNRFRDISGIVLAVGIVDPVDAIAIRRAVLRWNERNTTPKADT